MNALTFVLLLHTVFGLEVPDLRARERQTDFLNDFDGLLEFKTSNNQVLTGMFSEHDNGREDRRFGVRMSSADGLNCLPLSLSAFTPLDGFFSFFCPSNHALAGFRSNHFNDREDREWQFSCCDISSPDGNGQPRYRIHRQEVPSRQNSIDFGLDQRCNKNQVMVGLSSDHTNNREDRWYWIECALLVPIETRRDVQNALYLADRLVDPESADNFANNFDEQFAYENVAEGQAQVIEVGSSPDNVLTVPINADSNCPPVIDRSNRLGADEDNFTDTFSVRHLGDALEIRRIDAPVGWGLNLRFNCHKQLPVTIDIGYSDSNVRIVENVGNGALACPFVVTRDNWRNPPGSENFDDQFLVEVLNGRDVRVTRTDSEAGWGLYLRVLCYEANNGVFVGMSSVHDNNREDRRFRFETMALPGLDCNPMPWTAFQNDFDEELRFTCPGGHAIAGMGSRHDNNREDREWQFRCCEVAKNGYELGESRMMSLHEAPNSSFQYDIPDFQRCEANEVMVGVSGWHSNDREDRLYSIECAVIARPPPPAPTFDDCIRVQVVDAIENADFSGPIFGPTAEQMAEVESTNIPLDNCGNARVPGDLVFTTSGTQEVSSSDTLELGQTLDTVFSFGVAVDLALSLGIELVREINRKIRPDRSMSLGVDFGLGGGLDAGLDFGFGSSRNSATTTSTRTIATTSLEATFTPLPFQSFVAEGRRMTQEVSVPLRLTLQCIRSDGGIKEAIVDSLLRTEGSTDIEITFEDRTDRCPQSYYRNCECVPNLASTVVGTGCNQHPDFIGNPGCYTYRGNGLADSCSNGEFLQTIAGGPDEGVDGLAFAWSYIPCNGDQYYPGDRLFNGVNFDDLVQLQSGMQCQEGAGGTLSQEAFSTRNSAIEACEVENLRRPNTCLGVYDPQCDNVGNFFLCSTRDPLLISNGGASPSCVYSLNNLFPSRETSVFATPENGFLPGEGGNEERQDLEDLIEDRLANRGGSRRGNTGATTLDLSGVGNANTRAATLASSFGLRRQELEEELVPPQAEPLLTQPAVLRRL